MMAKVALGMALVGGLGLVCPVGGSALEEFGVYENWMDGKKAQKTIRSDRWRGDEDFGGLEVTRELLARKLTMRYRVEGNVVASPTPTGFLVARNHLRFARPTTITAIEGTFTVDRNLSVVPCAANNTAGGGTVTQVGPTHIALARVNDGSSTGPGDRTGDIEGVISTVRNGSSTDAPGILQAFGAIIRSTAPAGDFSQTLSRVPLGPVRTGQAFVLRMVWDKPNKQFLFSLNGGTPEILGYTQSDSAEAVVPFAQIFQRHQAANCHDDAAAVDATTKIGPVLTNASAVIP